MIKRTENPLTVSRIIYLIVMLATILITVALTSCESKEDECYKFTITETTTATPQLLGYPKVVDKETFTKCGLTAEEAQGVADGYNQYSTSTGGGYTFTVSNKCTYIYWKK